MLTIKMFVILTKIYHLSKIVGKNLYNIIVN